MQSTFPLPPWNGQGLSHRTILRMGRYQAMDISGMDPAVLIALLRQMLRLRMTEEAILKEYHPADEIRCPVHFCIGQEAVPAALSLILQTEDYLFSHHRSHGYYFAKNAPMREFFAEIYGRATGANQGRAGSMDISHHALNFFGGAILAGAIGIAVGVAYALHTRGKPHVSVAGFGEGATEEGAFWEAMNYAGLHRLPVIFICENNRYSVYSDQCKRQALDNICERVATFGVRTRQIFGNDVALTYRTLKSEVEAVRAGSGPALIEAMTYRWNSHVGPEDDSDNVYRTAEELAFWKRNCPIELLEENLRATGYLPANWRNTAEVDIRREIAENFAFAKSSAFPENANWPEMNSNPASPEADRLLGSSTQSDFDHDQPEAKLAPY